MSKSERTSIINQTEAGTHRLEALTDAIFAIAMTLLVLEIQVPDGIGTTSVELWQYLQSMWPHVLSFIISFVVLGMFWVAHHTEFRYIRRVDHKLLWLSIFYLLFVSLLPFSAGLLGRYPTLEPAIIVYGLHLIMLVFIHYFIWHHAVSQKLIDSHTDPRVHQAVMRMGVFAIVGYVLAIMLSFFDWHISLIIYTLVPLPYILGRFYRLP